MLWRAQLRAALKRRARSTRLKSRGRRMVAGAGRRICMTNGYKPIIILAHGPEMKMFAAGARSHWPALVSGPDAPAPTKIM